MKENNRSRRFSHIVVVKQLMLALCVLVLPTTVGCTLPIRSSDIKGATTPMPSKLEQTKFMFADDETEDNAQKKLVQTFPIGSDINKFISTMESMKDVTCSDNGTITGTKTQQIDCEYFIPSNEATTHKWIIFASNQHGKITKIHLVKNMTVYYPPTVDYNKKNN